MWSDTKKFAGWPIGEAIRRCADPKLLSQWFADRRKSQPTKDVKAAFRVARASAPKPLAGFRELDCANLQNSIVEQLLAARLSAWGRLHSAHAEPSCIPPSAWNTVRILNGRRPLDAENTQTKTKIFDLRIFPVIESPNAIDQLHGKTFLEAFRLCVARDPQLANLRERARAVGGVPASLGNRWGSYDAVWFARLAQEGGSDGALGYLWKFDEPIKYKKVQLADRILARRFAALIGLLSSGHLMAQGVPRGGGPSTSIPRSIWQRHRTYIDLQNGDLLKFRPHADCPTTALSKPIFTGLMLFKPDAASLKAELRPTDVLPQQGVSQTAAFRGVVTKTTSREACRAWLMALMRESPEKRPKPKVMYLHDALKKWPGTLSARAFNQVWSEAVVKTGASAWMTGGRPRKTPVVKPQHQ